MGAAVGLVDALLKVAVRRTEESTRAVGKEAPRRLSMSKVSTLVESCGVRSI